MFDPILWSDLPWGTSVHVPISVSIGFSVSTKADAPSHHNFFFFDYFHTDWDSSQDHIRSSHIHLHSFHKLVVLPKVIEINSYVCAIRTNPEILNRVLNLP